MIRFRKSLSAWNSPAFQDAVKQEIAHLDAGALPLQQGLSQGSHANCDNVSAIILSAAEQPGCIRVKAGLFFTSIIAGCSCADDPTPIGELSEYCVVQLDIDKQTAETTVTLLPE